MLRSIKLHDRVYHDLRALQRPRESYSQVIERIIKEHRGHLFKEGRVDVHSISESGRAGQ